MPPSTPFPNEKKSNSFSFKQGYCFLRAFRKLVDQKFREFYDVYYNIFIFSNNTGEINHFKKVRYFRLDLLKSFLLWTIQKKTAMSDSLNVEL